MRFALVILLTVTVCVEAAPVILGLHHTRHGLDEKQQGRILISELRCVACHASESVTKKSGADLSSVGSRLNTNFINKFIGNPALMDPGTQMPDLLANNAKRHEIAEALTHYLVSLSSKGFSLGAIKDEEFESGKNCIIRSGV